MYVLYRPCAEYTLIRYVIVVSASSDGSVKAWNPHSSPLSDPTTVGTHQDYVRCLGQRYVGTSKAFGVLEVKSLDHTWNLRDIPV